MGLDSVVGNLQSAYTQITPGTMQTAAALQVERHTDRSMRNQWFYTADGPLYYIGEGRELKPDGKVMLALTQEKDNLVFRHLDDKVKEANSFVQLIDTGNYFPKKEEAVASITAPETVVIDLAQVRLKGENEEYQYFEIGTSPEDYDKLNGEERKLASAYHGSMAQKECSNGDNKSDFEITMKGLREHGIYNTRIFVVTPGYVQKHTSNEKPVLARASWLDSFNDYSDGYAYNHNINYDSRVRGVRRVVVAPKVESPERHTHVSTSSSGSIEALMKEFAIQDEAEVRKAFGFYCLHREMLK